MTVNLSALAGAGQQFFDNNGNVLSGGKLWSYEAGTTTPQPTYTTAAGNVAHTNPIILDSAGRVPSGQIWLDAGENYKFVLMTSADVTLASYDNITGINGTGIATNAEFVAYDPPFTNAVQTNVEAKLAQTVSVKDFGAVGDGVTDDTVTIQDAIDYCNSLGGYIALLFDAGKTYLTGRLTPKTGVLLSLQGATLKLANNTDLPILYDGGSGVGSRFGLINGTLDCNQDFNKASNICGGLWLNEWDDVEVRNLTIKNCSRVGLYFYYSTQVLIDNYNFIDSGTPTATAAVKFSYALGIGLNTTTGDNCNNVVVKNIKASNLYGYGILVLGSTNISIENVTFDNFFFLTSSIGITLSESLRINVNNVAMNDIIGDNFEINGCEDVVVNNVEIKNAGIRPLLVGQNTPGTFNKRLTLSNFKITGTVGTFSLSLSFIFDSTLKNFNCDKSVSGISTAGTSGNNCVTDSIFAVASPTILLAFGFYRLENVQFNNVTYQLFGRSYAKVTGRTVIEPAGVFNIDMATLFNIFMIGGDRNVAGTLSIHSIFSAAGSQGSYQSCDFYVNDFGTAANLSAVTQVNNTTARALTIAGDAANKRITLTNGSGVQLTSSFTIDLVGNR